MDYTTALSKGRSLLHLLHLPTTTTTTNSSVDHLQDKFLESPFKHPSALAAWGYTLHTYTPTPCADLHYIQTALNVPLSQNTGISHSHLDSCVHNGIYVGVTWAKFNTVVNGPGGMLVAVDNESPTALARTRNMDPTALPELRFWSDVAFLQWESVTKGEAELRYVVRLGVTNQATMAVVRTLLEREGECEGWPDTTWRDEEAIAAILGTPNGSGVARLLVQHRRRLGWKVVEEVRLVGWRGVVPAIGGEPSLVFVIGNRGERVVRENGMDMDMDMDEGEDQEDEVNDEDMGFWIFDEE